VTSFLVKKEIVTSSVKEDSAHIVMVPDGEPDESPQAYVLRARIEGFPVTALCGFTWVPNRQAAGLPVCQECLDIYQQPGENRDDREDLPDE
jgi:hypothetical protein